MISALSLSSMALGIAALAEPAGEPDVPGRTMKNVESLYQAVTVITGVTVLLIVEYYIFDYRMRRQDCKTMKIDQKPFWGPNCIPLLVEILVHLPHPIPTHGWEEYSLYFTSAMFARVYTGLRVIAYNHAAYPMRFDVFGPKVDKYPTVRVWWATMVKITFLQHSGTQTFAPGTPQTYAPGSPIGTNTPTATQGTHRTLLQTTPVPSTFAPGTPNGLTFAPGTLTGATYSPGTLTGSTYAPGTLTGSTYAPGTPNGATYAPGTPAGGTFAPGTSTG
eukprot:PhF_6_TR4468/c1_g1_i7/m.6099